MDPSARLSDFLITEHARLEQQFDEARRAVSAGAWAEARSRFAELERGMKRHIEREESVLFPVFEERARIAGPIPVMREEHKHFAALCTQGKTQIDAEDAIAFEATAADLTALTVTHNIKERSILYPKTERLLSDEEQRQLIERFLNE